MTNKFLLNRLGFNPDLTTRQSRVDSLSLVSRQSDLAIYDVPKKEQAVRGINGQELR